MVHNLQPPDGNQKCVTPKPSESGGVDVRNATQAGEITVAYLGSEFPVDLYRCPQCGFVLVSEDLALGKMAEVEQMLEDK